jgi:hypothetical protein
MKGGVLGNDKKLGEGSEDVNNVKDLQDGQVRAFTYASLEKVYDGLWVLPPWNSVDQSCVTASLPYALKQANMKTKVVTMKRITTILG